MVGIDIIRVERFQKIKEGDFQFWDKFFTRAEWQHAFSQANFGERLAGIFAAKEAVIKADGKKKIQTYGQVEICHNDDGQPFVKLNGELDPSVQLSISHDRDFAIAIALIE